MAFSKTCLQAKRGAVSDSHKRTNRGGGRGRGEGERGRRKEAEEDIRASWSQVFFYALCFHFCVQVAALSSLCGGVGSESCKLKQTLSSPSCLWP